MVSGYISVDYDGLEKRKYDANHVSDDICGVLATEFYPNMKKVNNYLVELRDLINNDSEFGLGEIAYSDKSVELDELEWNYNILFNFPIDFEKELQGVDDDFNTEFINDALALLSELNVDDIELNVTNTSVVIMTSDGKYDEATGQVNYLNREYGASENAFDDIDRLTIADFIGYDGNGGEIYYTRYMEGFTDVLFSSIMEEDESINDFLVRNAADMEQLVHGADFSQQKVSSALVNFIAEAVDLASLGVVPLVEGFVGYDFIRGDELDEFESVAYSLEGTVDFITVGVGGAVGGKLSQAVFNEIAQEAVGQTVSYVAKNSGANEGTAFVLEMAARIAAGGILDYNLAKNGGGKLTLNNNPIEVAVADEMFTIDGKSFENIEKRAIYNMGESSSGRKLTGNDLLINNMYSGGNYNNKYTYNMSNYSPNKIKANVKSTVPLDGNLDGTIKDNSAFLKAMTAEESADLAALKIDRLSVTNLDKKATIETVMQKELQKVSPTQDGANIQTVMQKVLTKEDIEKYYVGFNSMQVGGCVTTARDATPFIYNIDTAYKDLRLDYTTNHDWVKALEANDDLFVIRFKSDDTINLKNTDIPLLNTAYGPPCTETGFVGSARVLMPEYEIKNRITMSEASIFTIDLNGNERLYGYLQNNKWTWLADPKGE